jgi:hypothetical protein
MCRTIITMCSGQHAHSRLFAAFALALSQQYDPATSDTRSGAILLYPELFSNCSPISSARLTQMDALAATFDQSKGTLSNYGRDDIHPDM